EELVSHLIRLIGRRLVALPLMVIGATLLAVVVMSFSPADPARLALGESASPQALANYRAANGLHDPLWLRYFPLLGGLVQGDLGTSSGNVPVLDMVVGAFPITLQLTFLGLAMAVVIAAIFGVLGALFRDTWVDQAIRVVSIGALATPSFWLAILLVPWLGEIPGGWGAFPALVTRWVSASDDAATWLRNSALPAFALAAPVAGSRTRVVRAAVAAGRGTGHRPPALRAGVPYTELVPRNVLRNALITPITVLGLRVGYLMRGAVIIEIIFNIQAMGQLILDGVTRNDVFLVQGVTLTVAIAFIVVNILVDLLYVVVNPRIRSI